MQLPPRNTWNKLSITELYNTKTQLENMYYDMRAANVSFASQYAKFISELDALILSKEQLQQQQQ